MTTITVYDPPMCCSTGVCGAEVDQRLVDFAADLDWLKAQGAAVRRIALSQEPMEFVTQPAIKALMDASGGDDLPAVLVGGAIVSQGRYPSRAELAAFAGIAGAQVGAAAGAQASAPAPRAKQASSCCGGAKADAAPGAKAGSCC